MDGLTGFNRARRATEATRAAVVVPAEVPAAPMALADDEMPQPVVIDEAPAKPVARRPGGR